MQKAKVKAIAPWFGGKRTMATAIVEELGPHRSYFELGCGSMAVLMAKQPSPQETAVDLHGHLINLGQVIQADRLAPVLYDKLQRTLCSEKIFEDSRAWYQANPEIDERQMPDVLAAYHYFIVSWMGRNGVAGMERKDWQMAVRWTPGGGSSGVRFRSATESLPWWHRRLRQALILRRDMYDVLPRIEDDASTAIYVDPTYLRDTRSRGRYEHELSDGTGTPGEKNDDHARLAECLARFDQARVVVTYYDHPRLAKLYPTWRKRDMAHHKHLHLQNRRGSARTEAPEVLLINGASFAQPQRQMLF